MDISKIKDIGLVSFKFDDLTLSDDGTVLASVLMFKEMGFTQRFHIDDKVIDIIIIVCYYYYYFYL